MIYSPKHKVLEQSGKRDDPNIALLIGRNGKVLSLNGSASELWEVIKLGATLDDMVRRLTASYNVSSAVAQADCEELLSSLLEKGMIVQSEAPPPTDHH